MANYHGKYTKPSRSRIYFWIGIGCAIPALVCAFFVGSFLVGAVRARNDRSQTIQTYVIPAAAVSETAAPEQMSNEETIPPLEVVAEPTEETTVSTQPPRFPTIDFAGLREKNTDVVAWLQIPALEIIDYPVVLGEDNAYYTTHTWDKEESENGAIFLDFRNQGDFSQIHNVIYGHCMKDGTMFQSLGEWEKESFQKTGDKTLLLYLPGETRVYEIFAVERVNALDSRVFKMDYTSGEDWEKALQETVRVSYMDSQVDLSGASEVVTLSTCIGGMTRLVVHAVCVEKVPV